MKILYIVTLADGGGAQKYVLDLAKNFSGSIAAGNEYNQLFAQAEKNGIKTYPLRYLKRGINPFLDILAFFEIFRLIKKLNPDIVHLNSSKAGFLGSIAGKLAGARVVFTAHGFFYFKDTHSIFRWVYTFVEKFASHFRDFIISVSEEDRQNALQYHIIPAGEISTIHNGISPINFLPRDRAQKALNLPSDSLVIGNIAQHYHRKGLDLLIEAVQLLPPDLDVKIILIGDGPERVDLEKKIDKYGLSKKIQLNGHLFNAPQYLKAFDLFILSSRKEGFPFVLLEAMQAGVPIIATDVGGSRELLGLAGLVVEPNNPAKLAQAIVRLAADADLRKKLAEMGPLRCQKFSVDEMFGQTAGIYEKILNSVPSWHRQ